MAACGCPSGPPREVPAGGRGARRPWTPVRGRADEERARGGAPGRCRRVAGPLRSTPAGSPPRAGGSGRTGEGSHGSRGGAAAWGASARPQFLGDEGGESLEFVGGHGREARNAGEEVARRYGRRRWGWPSARVAGGGSGVAAGRPAERRAAGRDTGGSLRPSA